MKSEKIFTVAALVLIFNLILVSGSCSSDEININKASKSELEKIKWIGPSTANETVKSRPFKSLEDLKKVKYLGDKKLKGIKNQSLACVESNNKKQNEENEEKADDEEKLQNESETNEDNNRTKNQNKGLKKRDKETNPKKQSKKHSKEPIKLSAKDIKNQTNTKNSQNEGDYSKYGLIGLTILVILLFLARELKEKTKYKNEFS